MLFQHEAQGDRRRADLPQSELRGASRKGQRWAPGGDALWVSAVSELSVNLALRCEGVPSLVMRGVRDGPPLDASDGPRADQDVDFHGGLVRAAPGRDFLLLHTGPRVSPKTAFPRGPGERRDRMRTGLAAPRGCGRSAPGGGKASQPSTARGLGEVGRNSRPQQEGSLTGQQPTLSFCPQGRRPEPCGPED